MAGKFKILKRKADCVLLYKAVGNDTKYMVKDIEGDIVYINFNDLDGAIVMFNEYDLEKIKADKKREFEKWLEEFTEA